MGKASEGWGPVQGEPAIRPAHDPEPESGEDPR